MDVLLAILCIVALVLLLLGKREGFAADCGMDGSPPPASWGVLSVPLRVYTQKECEKRHDGIWYDGGRGDGLGTCRRKAPKGPFGDETDLSQECAYLNENPAAPAAPAAPAVPPAPVVTSTTAPLPAPMPTPTGGNTITSLPIPGMPSVPSVAPQAASVMTSTPVGAPLGSGTPHGILLTMV
jgi:hypothetical protein